MAKAGWTYGALERGTTSFMNEMKACKTSSQQLEEKYELHDELTVGVDLEVRRGL
jgi:hypothetical protein